MSQQCQLIKVSWRNLQASHLKALVSVFGPRWVLAGECSLGQGFQHRRCHRDRLSSGYRLVLSAECHSSPLSRFSLADSGLNPASRQSFHRGLQELDPDSSWT